MFLISKKSTRKPFFFPFYVISLDLNKTSVPFVTIKNPWNLHKKAVDNVYNLVYKCLLSDFVAFFMWITFTLLYMLFLSLLRSFCCFCISCTSAKSQWSFFPIYQYQKRLYNFILKIAMPHKWHDDFALFFKKFF